MTISGKPLYLVLMILMAWLLALCWALWQRRANTHANQGTRDKLAALGLVCSTVAVGALLALHLSWISAALSQRMGTTGIRIITLFLFWPTLIGFFTSLFATGKIRFISLGTCILTGSWWLSLWMQAAISMGASTVRHPISYSIPEGYIGWVAIEYNVSGTPKLPLRNGSFQVKFPSTGILRTQSSIEDGWARDQYVYYSSSGQTKTLKDTGWDGGGMIWAATVSGDSDGRGGMNHIEEKFFVGTEDQYKQSPGVTDDKGKAEVGNQQH